jgi:hypothetical protein
MKAESFFEANNNTHFFLSFFLLGEMKKKQYQELKKF